jgi:hypothetical protein
MRVKNSLPLPRRRAERLDLNIDTAKFHDFHDALLSQARDEEPARKAREMGQRQRATRGRGATSGA